MILKNISAALLALTLTMPTFAGTVYNAKIHTVITYHDAGYVFVRLIEIGTTNNPVPAKNDANCGKTKYVAFALDDSNAQLLTATLISARQKNATMHITLAGTTCYKTYPKVIAAWSAGS